jgi:hypothetical protein
MLKKIIITYILFFVCFSNTINAQSVKDSTFRILMVGIHLGGQIPQNDLANRFGSNLSVGASFECKTKHNVLFNLEGSYVYGKKVKEDIVSNIRNDNGDITDNEGFPADLRITHRGWNVTANVGYVFSKLGHNPNSGLFFTVGGGYMLHKSKLYDANKKVAAVKGDLQKGYDNLTGGFSLSQFIGYKYLSNNRLANFYVGFEFYEGFTKNLRGVNFNTGLTDTKKRLDVITGFRFGWILPLYKRTKDFYYF